MPEHVPGCQCAHCGNPREREHAYGCRCQRCVSWAKAITAQNPDGSYCFTDDELYQMAMAEDEEERKIQ